MFVRRGIFAGSVSILLQLVTRRGTYRPRYFSWRRLLPLLLALGCGGEAPDAPDPDMRTPLAGQPLRSVDPPVLRGRILTDSDTLGQPFRVRLVGDRLLVYDLSGDPFFHLIDASSGEILESFGRKGDGPGDLQGIFSILTLAEDEDHARIFDPSLRRITEYWIRGPAAGNVESIVSLSGGNSFRVGATTDSTAIAFGTFEGGSFARIDEKGEIGVAFGSGPPGPEEVPMLLRHQAYSAEFLIGRKRRRLALAYHWVGRIDLFDLDGRKVGEADVPNSYDATFTPAPEDQRRYGWTYNAYELPRAYYDMDTNEKMIVALYSGNPRSSWLKELGNEVHLFDWSGKRLGVWVLDVVDATTVAIDAAGKTLWTAVLEPKPAIRVYRLDEQ